MTNQNADVERLFHTAAELTDLVQRQAFLASACGDDLTLLANVESLLAHDALANGPLDSPEQQTTANSPSGNAACPGVQSGASPEQSGMVVAGRYKLLEQIGEGGMGTVWVADQTQPVRRKVALKLVKPGMDSRQVLARFEIERQALALMDHPHIAKVLDGGLTEAGRPFFVMEHVQGISITKFCDATRSSVPERLQLFLQVCHAVQHAHQKGIIHRDLKPSNILVALDDDRPISKVIDFGLAKAMREPLTDYTLYSTHGTVLGTPQYMSPEQAQLNNLDVDTRADIYSLGILLYELLTGSTPLEKQRLKAAAWQEVLRLIQEEEPPRPSTRLSSAGTLPALAACRQLEPGKLAKFVQGELDWIVMKALEKDRNRRYETANDLALDIQRYLAGDPVQAAPPSAGYRLRKFARKHRAMLSTAAIIGVLLAASAGTSTWQAIRATNAERNEREARQAEGRRAESEIEARQEAQRAAAAEKQARHEAVAAAQTEKQAREQAQKRLEQIEKSNNIVLSIFTDIDINQIKAGSEPLEAILATRLMKVAEELEIDALGDPLTVASLQNRLGITLYGLGHAEAAIPLFVKAGQTRTAELGADHPDTLTSMNWLGQACREAGELDRAVSLLDEALRLRTLKLGADHSDTLTSMNCLGQACRQAGKLDRAVLLLEAALRLRKMKLGADHPDTIASMTSLGAMYRSVGKLDLMLPLCEESLRLSQAQLGIDHPDTLESMADLAYAYRETGRMDRAQSLLEEALRLKQGKIGAEHPDTLTTASKLALVYQDVQKFDLALPLFEETLRATLVKLGTDHPVTLAVMNNLAIGYQNAGKLDRAVPLFEEALRTSKVKLGVDHPSTLMTMNNLGMAYRAAGQWDLARSMFEETVQLRKEKLGPAHPDTLWSMSNLALVYRATDRLDLAMPLQQAAAAGMESHGFQHKNAGSVVANLIASHERMQQFAEAEVWRRKWAAAVQQRQGADSLPYAEELAKLGGNLLQQQKWPEAEHVLRECLAIREKLQPDEWNTFDTRVRLGGALLARKKYADAEPLLQAGFQAMKQRTATIPRSGKPRFAEAFERLRELYSATNQPDQITKLQDKLTPSERSLVADVVIGRELAAGRPREAIPYLSMISVANPQDTMLSLRVAALQAWFGQEQELAATRRRVLALAKDSDDMETLERAAKVASMRPAADQAELDAALALARRIVEIDNGKAWNLLVLGMAEYRSGHFAQAGEALSAAMKRSEDIPVVAATSAFYLAMSLFRQGQLDQARHVATEAAAKMRPLPIDGQNPLAGNSGHDDLVLWLACQEAQTLLQSPKN
ncbi:MAG TPA: serine/threonine-protein kinase [Planctomycetaceae bacterium]|jgi:serine/threonine protein kinase